MKNEQFVYVMVGLQGSGKSSYIKERFEVKGKEHIKVVSSDKIREELYPDENYENVDNARVFREFYDVVKSYLKQGYSVVLDATNINRKRRKHLVTQEFADYDCIAVYMNTAISRCIFNNSTREDRVPTNAIMNYRKNLTVPTYSEGWFRIEYIKEKRGYTFAHSIEKEENFKYDIKNEVMCFDYLFDRLSFMTEFEVIRELSQDNPNHTFSVGRHTYYTYRNVLDNILFNKLHEHDQLKLKLAAIFHDIGKGEVKSFTHPKRGIQRYANFINHENVSGQVAAYRLCNLGYSIDFVADVVELVQSHMKMMNGNKGKIEKEIGSRLYRLLEILHEADMKAK